MVREENHAWESPINVDQRASLVQEAIVSPHFVNVRRRIFRQLVESLIFEEVIRPEVVQEAEEQVYILKGVSQSGEPITYHCYGKKHLTFGRIRLSKKPIIRQFQGEKSEAESLAQFLLEIAPEIGTDQSRLVQFIHELEQTLLKDTLAQYDREISKKGFHPSSYDELEGWAMDGHPYHPSYKSRIGFDYMDHYAYGPEFQQKIAPLWLAVRQKWTRFALSFHLSYQQFLSTELGQEQMETFTGRIKSTGENPEEYLYIPIHPWQWQTVITAHFLEDIRRKDIILLGSAKDEYIPQQSIRTLSNSTSPKKSYLKLSLSMINTSTGRILAPHTVENAPIISDWLKSLVEKDPYLCEEHRLVLLGEVMGVSYDRVPLADSLQSNIYGVLSCIWRESIHNYIDPEEEAIPFQALCTLDAEGRPLIAPWIEKYGTETWLSMFLRTSILPLVHFLYFHGIALESHAQNMILLHKDGVPTRLALKDFHDGIRFSRNYLADKDSYPSLKQTPEYHARINRNSFIETSSPEEVRDFVHDAFFFINIGELALFMAEHFSMDEKLFWTIARNTIETYQQRFPELKERFQLFDLFAPTIGIEQLTKRRLFPDTELRIIQAKNPLCSK